jgi:diacylglycerol kinase (ATP)
MRVAAILGPQAGERDLQPFQSPGVELAPVAGLVTNSPFDAALIFGGDGSVHRQLAAAIESQIPILCVPTGSGNDFARALGLATFRLALSAWQQFCAGHEKVRAVDIAEIASLPGMSNLQLGTHSSELTARRSEAATENSLYCCVAGAGLDSEVNRRANRLPSWLRGHGGYVLSLAPALAAFQPPEISVELFDSQGPRRIAGPATLVAFANAPSYGHGMRIAPRAQLDDGKLDVCFVRRTPKLRLLRLFPRVFGGAHLDLPEVCYAQCSGLTISSDPPLDIFGDGEFIARTPAEIRIRPRALRAIVCEATCDAAFQ